MPRYRFLVPFAVLIALLATSCLDVSIDVAVHDDGSGSAKSHMSVDPKFLELMADPAWGEYETPEAACDSFLGEASPSDDDLATTDGEDDEFTSVNEDGVCEFTHTVTWSEDGPGGEWPDGFGSADEAESPINRTETGWRFWLPLDLPAETDSALQAEQAGIINDVAAVFGIEPGAARISVTLPGVVLDHNADSIDGSTLTWEFALTEMPDGPLFAETTLDETSIIDNGDDADDSGNETTLHSESLTPATEEPQQSGTLEVPRETPVMTQSTEASTSPTTTSATTQPIESSQPSSDEGRKLAGSIITGAVIAALIIGLIVLNRRRRRG